MGDALLVTGRSAAEMLTVGFKIMWMSDFSNAIVWKTWVFPQRSSTGRIVYRGGQSAADLPSVSRVKDSCGCYVQYMARATIADCWRLMPWLQIRFDFDCDSTTIRLPFHCSSTALRPFDNLRYSLPEFGPLHCDLNK